MLYNPEWTKPDPLSLPALIAWLETQAPETAYDYYDCGGGCLIMQYLTAVGIEWRDGGYGRCLGGQTSDLRHEIAGTRPFTFGAALARAKALFAETVTQ